MSSYTGWHKTLFKTSCWLKNKSSTLDWLGQGRPGQNGTSVLKSTEGFKQRAVSPCIKLLLKLNVSVARILSVSLCLSFSQLLIVREPFGQQKTLPSSGFFRACLNEAARCYLHFVLLALHVSAASLNRAGNKKLLSRARCLNLVIPWRK